MYKQEFARVRLFCIRKAWFSVVVLVAVIVVVVLSCMYGVINILPLPLPLLTI